MKDAEVALHPTTCIRLPGREKAIDDKNLHGISRFLYARRMGGRFLLTWSSTTNSLEQPRPRFSADPHCVPVPLTEAHLHVELLSVDYSLN